VPGSPDKMKKDWIAQKMLSNFFYLNMGILPTGRQARDKLAKAAQIGQPFLLKECAKLVE
jgi:hypothetical protein